MPWPSCFTGQYGREAHLTQNNIPTDGDQTSSRPALWLKPWYLLTLLLLFYLPLPAAISRSFPVTEVQRNSEVKGQTWLLSVPRGRLNLSSSSPSIDQWQLSLHAEAWISTWLGDCLGASCQSESQLTC